MVLIPYTVLLGAALLSVKAQITSAPGPAATSAAGAGPEPLTQYHFTYPNVPEKVNPYPVGRGPQSGYNICNSTTEGPASQCQTMFVNDITDFCLWGSPTPNSLIGDVEAVVVAYCTKPGHGTRIIPPGTLTAVQFIKAPGYIQLTGLLNQAGIGLDPTDAGGELDPHGADLAGNPLGGLVFSNNLPSDTNGAIIQVDNWSNFLGGGQFCIKACDPTINTPDYCQNIYDTEGCDFNMPASYAPNEFLSCLGDNQAPPGPPGGAPVVIPATSSCTTYASSQLYPNTASTSATTPAATTGGAAATTTPRGSTPTASGSPGGAAATGSANAASPIAQPRAAVFAVVLSTMVAAFAGVVVF